jgi:hypothetical protein
LSTNVTDICGRPALDGPAIKWWQATARPGAKPGGSSWRKRAEAEQVQRCVEELVDALP